MHGLVRRRRCIRPWEKKAEEEDTLCQSNEGGGGVLQLVRGRRGLMKKAH